MSDMVCSTTVICGSYTDDANDASMIMYTECMYHREGNLIFPILNLQLDLIFVYIW